MLEGGASLLEEVVFGGVSLGSVSFPDPFLYIFYLLFIMR